MEKEVCWSAESPYWSFSPKDFPFVNRGHTIKACQIKSNDLSLLIVWTITAYGTSVNPSQWDLNICKAAFGLYGMHTEITRLYVLIQGIQNIESIPLLILTGITQTAHREEEWENILLSLNKPPLMWEEQQSGGRNDFTETLTVSLVGRFIKSKKPLRITVTGGMLHTSSTIQRNRITVVTCFWTFEWKHEYEFF